MVCITALNSNDLYLNELPICSPSKYRFILFVGLFYFFWQVAMLDAQVYFQQWIRLKTSGGMRHRVDKPEEFWKGFIGKVAVVVQNAVEVRVSWSVWNKSQVHVMLACWQSRTEPCSECHLLRPSSHARDLVERWAKKIRGSCWMVTQCSPQKTRCNGRWWSFFLFLFFKFLLEFQVVLQCPLSLQ